MGSGGKNRTTAGDVEGVNGVRKLHQRYGIANCKVASAFELSRDRLISRDDLDHHLRPQRFDDFDLARNSSRLRVGPLGRAQMLRPNPGDYAA
jgi:hypothetical protein